MHMRIIPLHLCNEENIKKCHLNFDIIKMRSIHTHIIHYNYAINMFIYDY